MGLTASTFLQFYSTPSGGGFGDPHLKTWSGQTYDYHGECDLILCSSDGFANGQGLDIHIRTTIRKNWSFISAAAVRIGNSILEVHSFGKYYVDGVEAAPLNQDFGGFRIAREVGKEGHAHQFHISTDEGKIEVRVFKDFIGVFIRNAKATGFGESVGLMGNYYSSAWLLRDGETMATDPNIFGGEWQVQDHEHQLFVEPSTVAYPDKCRLPDVSAQKARRRLEESEITVEMAIEACKEWLEDKDLCINDVLLTDDLDVALAGAY